MLQTETDNDPFGQKTSNHSERTTGTAGLLTTGPPSVHFGLSNAPCISLLSPHSVPLAHMGLVPLHSWTTRKLEFPFNPTAKGKCNQEKRIRTHSHKISKETKSFSGVLMESNLQCPLKEIYMGVGVGWGRWRSRM